MARKGSLGFIKVVGRGSFQNSGTVKVFYEQLLADGANCFVVDLEACTYLDSTFLGILLRLGLKLKEAGNGLLHILNANPRNLLLLKNLGLDRLIRLDSGVDVSTFDPEKLREIKTPTPTKEEAGPTILEAHETLMAFDPKNVPKFKDVVEFLKEDLGLTSRAN